MMLIQVHEELAPYVHLVAVYINVTHMEASRNVTMYAWGIAAVLTMHMQETMSCYIHSQGK